MEVLSFYWTNIIAGSVLVFVLGMFGAHLIARNKSMEIMLLGQELQVGILISALVIHMLEEGGGHIEHGFHLETLVSMIFALSLHTIYYKIFARYRSFRVESALALIILLMGISHILVKLSPSVEFHMVKTLLGDIVTVSKTESLMVSIIGIGLIFFLHHFRKDILEDTIELAIFNRTTRVRLARRGFLLATVLVMVFSVHLFGNIFTVGAMIIPALVSSLLAVPLSRLGYFMAINTLSVPIAFGLLLVNDQLPTTVLIIIIMTILSLVSSQLFDHKH